MPKYVDISRSGLTLTTIDAVERSVKKFPISISHTYFTHKRLRSAEKYVSRENFTTLRFQFSGANTLDFDGVKMDSKTGYNPLC